METMNRRQEADLVRAIASGEEPQSRAAELSGRGAAHLADLRRADECAAQREQEAREWAIANADTKIDLAGTLAGLEWEAGTQTEGNCFVRDRVARGAVRDLLAAGLVIRHGVYHTIITARDQWKGDPHQRRVEVDLGGDASRVIYGWTGWYLPPKL